jgi:hypothetical protein
MLWQFDYQDDTRQIPTDGELQPYKKNYYNPDFYFVVVVDGIKTGENQESGLMKFQDWVEIEFLDSDGNAVPDKKYKVVFSNGDEKSGTLDSKGQARIEKVPPGKIDIQFPLDDSKENEYENFKTK